MIHFIHSYVNDAHERRAREVAAAEWPNAVRDGGRRAAAGVPGVRARDHGGHQRLRPAGDRPLPAPAGRRARRARATAHELLVMQGNGGTMSVDVAARHAVNTLMSGPAAGVKAAAFTALRRRPPQRDLVRHGRHELRRRRDRGRRARGERRQGDGLRSARARAHDRHPHHRRGRRLDRPRVERGASCRWARRARGPSPDPSPLVAAASEPTITDANLLLGRLNPGGPSRRGGRRASRSGGARPSTRRSAPTWASIPVAAAAAIVRVANDKMAGAIRLVSLQRGRDPRDFVLFAFGGAGPLHAVALARELAIPKVLVPARPGHHLGLRLPGGRRAPRLRADDQPRPAAYGRGGRAGDPGRPDRRGAPATRHRRCRGRDGDCPARGRHAVRRSDPRAHGADRRHGRRRARSSPTRSSAPTWSVSAWSYARCAALVMSLRTAVIGRRRPIALDGLGRRRRTPVRLDQPRGGCGSKAGGATRRSTGASNCPSAQR